MRDSIPLGRVGGIPVGMHWTLIVVLGLVTVDLAGALAATADGATVLVAALAAIGLFVSVLVHELAHAFVARRHGVGVDGITLWLLGGVARIDGDFPSWRAQLEVAVAGPAASLVLSGGLGAAAVLGGALDLPALVVSATAWLAVVNLVLALFNLIPAAPLDGGRVLAAVLWARRGDRERATAGAARVGQVFGVALVLIGVWSLLTGAAGVWFLLLGGFIAAAASAERRVARMHAVAGGVRVRDVMTPVAEPAPGWITVAAFLERFVEGRHAPEAFVIERWEGGTAGVVPVSRLLAVPQHARSSTRVVELAVGLEHLRTACIDDDLAEAWHRPRSGVTLPHIVVVDHGRLVGLVTPDTIARVGAARRSISRGLGRP